MFLLQKNDYTMFQNKKVQLASFYSNIRKKYKILVTNDKPMGGKWSFDNENRKRLPKDYLKFDIPSFKSPFYKDIRKLIDKYFKSHFGEINENILFPFNHKDTQKSLAFFLKKKLSHFGDYEDFISSDDFCKRFFKFYETNRKNLIFKVSYNNIPCYKHNFYYFVL